MKNSFNKKILVLVIFLIILVAGFIIYNKVLKNNSNHNGIFLNQISLNEKNQSFKLKGNDVSVKIVDDTLYINNKKTDVNSRGEGFITNDLIILYHSDQFMYLYDIAIDKNGDLIKIDNGGYSYDLLKLDNNKIITNGIEHKCYFEIEAGEVKGKKQKECESNFELVYDGKIVNFVKSK